MTRDRHTSRRARQWAYETDNRLHLRHSTTVLTGQKLVLRKG